MSNYEDRLSKISGIVVPLSADEERKQREDPACILPMDYHLFLVNEGDHDVTDVAMYTGGFGGSDGPHIELNRITKPLGELKRGGAIQIEDLDYGILDFVLWYDLELSFADLGKLKAQFSIAKAYSLREKHYSPALRTDGYYFPLKPVRESRVAHDLCGFVCAD